MATKIPTKPKSQLNIHKHLPSNRKNLDSSAVKSMAKMQKGLSAAHQVSESTENLACCICMEILPISQLKQHKDCQSIICCSCLIRSLQYHLNSEDNNSLNKGQTICSLCKNVADLFSDFVDMDPTISVGPAVQQSSLATESN